MKSIVFDSGPIINLALNNLLWILKPLKKKFSGSFYICQSAKRELVDRPLTINRFKFEALQILRLINEGILEVVDNKRLHETTDKLLTLANQSFSSNHNNITLVQQADMEGIACSLVMAAEAYAVDERTARLFIEDQKRLELILKRRLRKSITVNRDNLKKFHDKVKHVRVIRSVEIVTIAFDYGLLDKYIANINEPRKTLLEGLLWGLKLNGCSISKREIKQIIKEEK